MPPPECPADARRARSTWGWEARTSRLRTASQSDDSKYHMDDWVRGMRTRTPCNGSIETGFAHSVAVVMATRSYREGKKMLWDREREEIREQA